MKNNCLLLLLVCSLPTAAQTPMTNVRLLSKSDIASIFPDSVTKRLNFIFPIRRAYAYTDNSGYYYLAFSEKFSRLNENGDSLYSAAKAISVKESPNGLQKKWEIADVPLNIPKKAIEENTITFWTKYVQLTDANADGLLDPVIVYGTMGANGFGDGRIKIITFYKGQKITIHHQNGLLDHERNTRIDKTFYTLPQKLQKQVRTLMAKMVENNHAIFPAGWENGMNKKALYIDENKSRYF